MSYEHHYYKPVVPPWVAEILAFEKQTGNIHHPDKARGQTRKDWQAWKAKYSRKLKYARLNGWVVETDAMRSNQFVYPFAIYDWNGNCHWYYHRAENELDQTAISQIETIILKANPRAASCYYRPIGKRSRI